MNVKKLATLAATLFTAAWVGQASALTTTQNCGGGGNADSYSLSVASQTSGCIDGNDTNTITPTYSILGETGWILADKSDPEPGDVPDGAIGLTIAGVGQTAVDPTWSLDLNNATFDLIMITLKQGNNFAAFLVDQANAIKTLVGFEGTWGTTGPGMSENALSHASVYYKGMTPIPLPAAAWLLFGGIGSFGLLRWRKRSVEA